jgi:4-hydroxy-tetrahydrodipicolinate reductase
MSRRYTVSIADCSTGVVRQVTIGLRRILAILAVAAGMLVLPILIGLGAKWSAYAEIDEVRSTIEPVITDRPGIARGRVASLRQSAVGIRDGKELVLLDLEMSVGAPDPHDRIVIEGDPPLDVLVRGGTHGDRGTVGTVLSAIPAVVAASPGLKTVLDLALGGGA